jgi:hypothetical protein
VLCAVELALEAGVATKTHVLNLLHRLTDWKGTRIRTGWCGKRVRSHATRPHQIGASMG